MNEEIKNAIDSLVKQGLQSTQLAALQDRAKRCVCKYCGSKLVLRKLTYGKIEEGRVEIFCPNCNRVEYGVEPEIYEAAKYLVKEINWDYFSEVENCLKKDRMNMSKAAEVISYGLDALGLLDEQGFRCKVEMKKDLLHEDILLSDNEI